MSENCVAVMGKILSGWIPKSVITQNDPVIQTKPLIVNRPKQKPQVSLVGVNRFIPGPKPAAADRSIRMSSDQRDEFFASEQWKHLRYAELKLSGRRCYCCGSNSGVMNVDHIIPLNVAPELKVKPWNLQTLCADCNQGKGWSDITNWKTGVHWSDMLQEHASEIGTSTVAEITKRVGDACPKSVNRTSAQIVAGFDANDELAMQA